MHGERVEAKGFLDFVGQIHINAYVNGLIQMRQAFAAALLVATFPAIASAIEAPNPRTMSCATILAPDQVQTKGMTEQQFVNLLPLIIQQVAAANYAVGFVSGVVMEYALNSPLPPDVIVRRYGNVLVPTIWPLTVMYCKVSPEQTLQDALTNVAAGWVKR